MIDFELTHENRIKMKSNSGNLFHVFGEGYYIIDEEGCEINTFTEEDEFNRVIEKFRFRHFLTEKLRDVYGYNFYFGEDNILFINGKQINDIYWNLPYDKNEIDLFFDYISDKFKLNNPRSLK